MTGVTARPRTNIQNANLQHVAGLGAFDRDGAGQQMHTDAFARAELERTFGRAGAAARDSLVFARPVKDAFGAGVAGDHAFVVVVCVMGERFDRRAVAGLQRQGRRNLLAEISPMHGGGRNGKSVMLHVRTS